MRGSKPRIGSPRQTDEVARAIRAHGLFHGWAEKSVIALCRTAPANLRFVLEADTATRHYVGLCLEAAAPKLDNAAAMQNLAQQIAVRNRRGLLMELFGADLGSPRLLSRLQPELFGELHYGLLAMALADPVRRAAFVKAGAPLTEDHVMRLALAHPKSFTKYHPRAIVLHEDDMLEDCLRELKRQHPDKPEQHLLDRINGVMTTGREFFDGYAQLFRDRPFPEPPWPGDERVRPLRTISEMKRAGRTYKNCLGRFRMWCRASTGDAAFYVVDAARPLIVEVDKERLTGVWRLTELEAVGGARVKASDRREILTAFAAVGVREALTPAVN